MYVLVLGMETHVFDSYIQGHHVSKDFWMPVIDEELVCAQQSGNPHDPYAVAIKKGSLVVGHVYCSYSNKSQLCIVCYHNYLWWLLSSAMYYQIVNKCGQHGNRLQDIAVGCKLFPMLYPFDPLLSILNSL